MQEIREKRISAIDIRARLPVVARALALFTLIAGVVFIGVSFYRMRGNQRFRLRSGSPELSKEVVGRVEGYEQRVTRDDRLYLLVRAARDIAYADGHHELEEVHVEVYPPAGGRPDQINADRSLYDPKNNVISFTGNVNIQTRDGLKVKTEAISYNQNTEVAETAALITFEREAVSGRATGAMVDAKGKRLELRNQVEVTVAPQALENAPAKPQKAAGLRAQPVTIRASQAVFEQTSMRLTFSGGATAEQGRDVMSGDNLTTVVNEQKRLQKVEVRGNSYLRSMEEGHAAEVHSVDMDFFFDGDQRLQRAVASRDIRAQTLDSDSQAEVSGPNGVEVDFQMQGQRSLLKEMRTDGRAVVTMAAPKSRPNDPRAAAKRLTADSVKLVWRSSGEGLEHAEAVGNTELFVDPVQQTAHTDRKTMTAPRFDCEFYETGNLARQFTATGGAKVVIDPVLPGPARSTRTLAAQRISAIFARNSQDVERLEAQGDARFNEKDTNGAANNAVYTAADQMVRLRGGEPAVWDSRQRTKAAEIDSDRANEVSYCRGKVQTSYYSQEQTNGAAPFSQAKSPVYIVAERAEFHESAGAAVYSGGARAWQRDNFVNADSITLYREEKRMEGHGHVQSGLYQARSKTQTASVVPVFASADSIVYAEPGRLLHYEGNVDIRQGTDRITSGVADVYLMKETNEVERTIAERRVVITQPGRRGTGDWVQYTAADEVAVLKGSPARVEDVEQGNMESGRVTVYARENRVVADDASGGRTGRVRTAHKVRKQ